MIFNLFNEFCPPVFCVCHKQNLNMSAGDLLNRTHEELILLLIQLRRQNCTTARAIEQCCTDIHDVQVIIYFIILFFKVIKN